MPPKTSQSPTDKTEPKTAAEQSDQILATLESLRVRLTTVKPSRALSASEKKQRREKWMAKWLPMEITHPDLNTARESLCTYCAELAASPARGRTLVIFGENGSGKTKLVKQVADWMKHYAAYMPLVNRPDLEDSQGVAWQIYANWPTVIDEFQKRKEIAIVDDMMIASLVVLDDIGAEHDPSGYGKGQLYMVLTRREFKWNLITTNFPPKEWYEKFERRIASRLFRNAEHIDLSKVPDFSTI